MAANRVTVGSELSVGRAEGLWPSTRNSVTPPTAGGGVEIGVGVAGGVAVAGTTVLVMVQLPAVSVALQLPLEV